MTMVMSNQWDPSCCQSTPLGSLTLMNNNLGLSGHQECSCLRFIARLNIIRWTFDLQRFLYPFREKVDHHCSVFFFHIFDCHRLVFFTCNFVYTPCRVELIVVICCVGSILVVSFTLQQLHLFLYPLHIIHLFGQLSKWLFGRIIVILSYKAFQDGKVQRL